MEDSAESRFHPAQWLSQAGLVVIDGLSDVS